MAGRDVPSATHAVGGSVPEGTVGARSPRERMSAMGERLTRQAEDGQQLSAYWATVLLHFGETDASIPPEHWERIRKAHPNVPMHVYPGAGHGFSCDERASFHEASHQLALDRTLACFKQHVG